MQPDVSEKCIVISGNDARHKLKLGLPHYTCGVTTGTVAVGNEIQLLCS